MKISYAITVCNEFVEIQKLLTFLIKNKRIQDEIVVLYDSINGDPEVEAYLRSHSENNVFKFHKGGFKGHFADWKNQLNTLCNGDFIFQVDADEMLNTYILDMLPEVLEHNDVDIFKVPRINTVDGLTQDHIQKWRWHVNEQGWVNYPDYQWRIYRNDSKIRWMNKVHEVLTGYKTMAYLPKEKEWSILHPKTIERQEKQNNFYEKL